MFHQLMNIYENDKIIIPSSTVNHQGTAPLWGFYQWATSFHRFPANMSKKTAKGESLSRLKYMVKEATS